MPPEGACRLYHKTNIYDHVAFLKYTIRYILHPFPNSVDLSKYILQ